MEHGPGRGRTGQDRQGGRGKNQVKGGVGEKPEIFVIFPFYEHCRLFAFFFFLIFLLTTVNTFQEGS